MQDKHIIFIISLGMFQILFKSLNYWRFITITMDTFCKCKDTPGTCLYMESVLMETQQVMISIEWGNIEWDNGFSTREADVDMLAWLNNDIKCTNHRLAPLVIKAWWVIG